MRVVHIVESLGVQRGGTAAACAQLANHLGRAGVDTTVLTLAGAASSEQTHALDAIVATRTTRLCGPARAGYSARARAELSALVPQDVVHVHGLWRLLYAQAGRFAADRHVPLAVSTHGMLHRAALARRGGLKRVARRLFQDAVIRRAACLHATADAELAEIRAAGFKGPVAVIPWGVAAPPARCAPVRARNRNGHRTALYLGRLHPGKGLETLLAAWAQLRDRLPAWRLTVAGYDEAGYQTALEACAASLGLAGAVTFAGPVEGDERERTFDGADLVVLPSPAENFGFVVPEALVRGVPVVATQGAPWRALVSERCGWWTPAGTDALAATLLDACGRRAEELRAMGERGRRFALEQFSWPRAAASMVALYDWLAGRGGPPAFVDRPGSSSGLDPTYIL